VSPETTGLIVGWSLIIIVYVVIYGLVIYNAAHPDPRITRSEEE